MKKTIYILIAIIVALLVWLGIYMRTIRDFRSQVSTIVRDTTIIIDTLKIPNPVFIYETLLDPVLVPILDTIRINDTLYLSLPKTQKYYAENGKYEAWVSGYKPVLDSIEIFSKIEVQTITKTIQAPQSRWGVGIVVGGGITYTDKVRLSPYVGIGVYYKLF